MISNIIKKTPSGNFMVLNYAKVSKDGYTVRVPVVEDLAAANRLTEVKAKSGRFCVITRSYYDRL